MSEISRLFVSVGARTDEYRKGMQQVKQKGDEVGKHNEKVSGWMEQNWKKIGAATAIAGAGIEALARKQAPLTQQTRQLARSLDMTESEMRDLARSTADVTFPLDEVLDLMEKGRQQGIRSAEQLQEYAQFWDTVGDATGESAVRLGEAGSALRAVGIAAGEEAEALSAFGFVAQETTSDVGEFLNFIERTGPELRELGMDIDGAAAMLGILEHEFGMAGRTARTEFRQAVNEADGDVNELMRTLGITEEQFAAYNGKVKESSDVIEENAKLHEESYTVLQKVQHWTSEVAYEYGGLLEVMSSLTPVLIAAGPIMKGIAEAKKLWTAKTITLTGAIHKLNMATKTLVGTISIAVGGALAIHYVLEKWRDFVDDVTESHNYLNHVLRNLPTVLLGPGQAVQSLIDTIKNWREEVKLLVGAINWLIDRLNAIPRVDIGHIGGGGANIPGLATGGTITSAGTALVGERGPELLHLPRGAQVQPLGAGGGVTITGNTFYVRDDRDIEKIARELDFLQRRKDRGV